MQARRRARLTSLSAKPTAMTSRASTPLIRPRLGALSFVMRIHTRVSVVPATATMIDAHGDTLLTRALHDAKRRPREPSRMPFDDDGETSGIERRWWAASIHSKRLFTQHCSIATHIPPFAMQSLSRFFLFFFRSLLFALVLVGAKLVHSLIDHLSSFSTVLLLFRTFRFRLRLFLSLSVFCLPSFIGLPRPPASSLSFRLCYLPIFRRR